MFTRDLENFSVVSVLAFTLPTPGRGAVAVTKDHKKSAALRDLITQTVGTSLSKTMDSSLNLVSAGAPAR